MSASTTTTTTISMSSSMWEILRDLLSNPQFRYIYFAATTTPTTTLSCSCSGSRRSRRRNSGSGRSPAPSQTRGFETGCLYPAEAGSDEGRPMMNRARDLSTTHPGGSVVPTQVGRAHASGTYPRASPRFIYIVYCI